MIELAQHIEYLLLENDCVILPGFGGFVAHYTEAAWNDQNRTFVPPMRTIGFNPQLKLNDGMLVQSVMEVYGTNYGDAQKMVRRWVDALQEQLYDEGVAELPNVGELRMSIRGTYDFNPYDYRLTSPWLYGLGSFEMPLLEEQPSPVPLRRPSRPAAPAAKERHVHRLPRIQMPAVRIPAVHVNATVWSGMAAMVAVLVLFFFFSTPVKNTELVKDSYARLMPDELFERIERQSLAVVQVEQEQKKKPTEVERVTVKRKSAEAKNTADAPKKAAAAKQPVAEKPKAEAKKNAGTPGREAKAKQPAEIKKSAEVKKPAEVKKSAEAKKPAEAKTVNQKPATYHLIVASVATEKDAREMQSALVKEGHTDARVVLRDGKNRVSIKSYATQGEATKAVEELRKESKYSGAWVLHCRI